MSQSTSILEDLLAAIPELRSQIYFKASLTALSHAMEDQVLAGRDRPLVIANFQRERFYRQEAHRYLRIAELTDQVYVLAAPETDFTNRTDHYEMVAFHPTDALSEEWHLVVFGEHYAACLICRERQGIAVERSLLLAPDQARRFEGVWTFDRAVVSKAAELLLARILTYRPELSSKVAAATALFAPDPTIAAARPGPERKVRAPQGSLLPNGKAPRWRRRGDRQCHRKKPLNSYKLQATSRKPSACCLKLNA